MPILPTDPDYNFAQALEKFKKGLDFGPEKPEVDEPYDPLKDFHDLTNGIPDYHASEGPDPKVTVKQPARRGEAPGFSSVGRYSGMPTDRPTQDGARDEISRAVQAAVMAKHAPNPSDNAKPDNNPDLQKAQDNAERNRQMNVVARFAARGSSLIAGRGGKYDTDLYDQLDKDADHEVKDYLARTSEGRAQEKEKRDEENHGLDVHKKQTDNAEGDLSLARNRDELDPVSNLSQGARAVLVRLIPALAKDPEFKNMSAADIKQHFPVLSKEIDSIKATEHEQHEDRRNAANNASHEKIALLNQNSSYKKSLADHMAAMDARKAAELSGRSFQNVVPVPFKIPTQKQATLEAAATAYHDEIDGLLQDIKRKYAEGGARYVMPDDGREGLQSDLETLRILVSQAHGQGAMTKGHHDTMMRIIGNPDLLKNAVRPEFFSQSLGAVEKQNHNGYREFSRANNYITRGEADFEDAVKNNAVPTVAPASKTPMPNPSAVAADGGGSASAGGSVSSRTPIAPGGIMSVRLKKDYKGHAAGTKGKVSIDEYQANPDTFERIDG